MTTATKLVDLEVFDPEAQQALRAARARCEESRGNLLDSKYLLAGLVEVGGAWPPQSVVRGAIREAQIGPATTEVPGDVVFMEARLSREAETVLEDAIERAFEVRRAQVTTVDMLWALSSSEGSEATQLMRAITQEVRPWTAVRAHLDRLAPPEGAESPEDAPEGRLRQLGHPAGVPYDRVVALVYCLIRDEVPAGKIVAFVQEIEQHPKFRFTNRELEALARSLVDRLWA